jgi:hypothetical protein
MQGTGILRLLWLLFDVTSGFIVDVEASRAIR